MWWEKDFAFWLWLEGSFLSIKFTIIMKIAMKHVEIKNWDLMRWADIESLMAWGNEWLVWDEIPRGVDKEEV